MSLNEVCRRAGVSKPGLYREFGSEDGLLVAVLARYAERVVQPILQRLEEEKPFGETFDWVLDFMTNRPAGAPAGCLIAKMRTSPSLLGPKTLEQLELLRATMGDAYTRWFSR